MTDKSNTSTYVGYAARTAQWTRLILAWQTG